MIIGPPPKAPDSASPPAAELLATSEGLAGWLKTQPREVSTAIAVRAALRVLPRFSSTTIVDESRFAARTVALFRANALARVAARYPNRANELRAGYANDAAVRAAAFAAVHAADAAARAGDKSAADAAYAAARAVRAITGAAASLATRAANAADAYTRAVASADALQAVTGRIVAVLDAPLWPTGAPEWATKSWPLLLARLPKGDDWDVWIKWYDERLRGVSRGEAYELVFASVPEAEWEKGAAAANLWIRQHLLAPSPPREPRQRPALHSFRLNNGRVAVARSDAHPADVATTEDLLDAAHRRVADLRKRLEATQADRRLQNTLFGLETQLAARLANLRVGLLADAYFALDADFEAYESPEGRAEHALDLIAELGGLRKSVRALIGRFEQGREILAEAAELDLSDTPGVLEKVEAASAEIAEIAAKNPDLVEPEVAEAVLAPAESIAQSRTRSERARHVAMRLFTDDNFANSLAEARKFAWEAWEEARKQAPKAAGKAVVGIPAAALALWLGHDGIQLLLETAGAIAGINAALGKKGGAFAEALALLRHFAAGKAIEPESEAEPPKPKTRKARNPPKRGKSS
jgi:hypothetical protein